MGDLALHVVASSAATKVARSERGKRRRKGKTPHPRAKRRTAPTARDTKRRRTDAAPEEEEEEEEEQRTAPEEEEEQRTAPEEEPSAEFAEEASDRAPPGRAKEASRRNPARSSAKTYSAFHMSAGELSRPTRPGKQEEVPSREGTFSSSSSSSSFGTLGLDPKVSRACEGLGLSRPTSVQVAACAALRRGNALVVAPTGSGKTLAYLLPVIDALHRRGARRESGTRALVIAPTAELCCQIADVAAKVARKVDVSIVAGAVTGGERRKSEKARLRKGVTILAATPGRLLDHLESTRAFRLEELEWVVLDEVDRLLDMGFGPQIDEVSGRLRLDRRPAVRTAVVTATVDAKLGDVAFKRLGRDHAVVDCGKDPNASAGVLVLPPTLRCEYCVVTLKARLAALAALLRAHPDRKTLVFASTCASAEFHALLATRSDVVCEERTVQALHGSMDRQERKVAYAEFCRAEAAVLFATDVAARGLDFDSADVDWVLHLDAPRDVGTFVHRSGRAARAGRDGLATLLVLPTERPFFDAMRARGLPLPRRAPVPAAHLGDDDAVAATWKRLAELVAGDAELSTAARAAFAKHLRAYASRADANQILDGRERDAIHHAFNLRKLHLGHAAKSFALDEPPRTVAKKLKEAGRKRKPSNPAAPKNHSSLARRVRPRTVGSTARALNQQPQNNNNSNNNNPPVRLADLAKKRSRANSEFGGGGVV